VAGGNDVSPCLPPFLSARHGTGRAWPPDRHSRLRPLKYLHGTAR